MTPNVARARGILPVPMRSSEDETLTNLLAHAGWMRRLARHLLPEAAADDVVQDTWAAVARQPPPADLPVQPWIAKVVRNFARMHVRGEQRRRAREATFIEDDRAAQGSQALLERAQMQHLVAALVMKLDEPFRSTVLLRYYEDRNATEIARLHGVEAGTVRWRLKVALDRVRAALDDGDRSKRRTWVAIVGSIALEQEAAALVATGVMVMKKNVIVAALLALGLVGGVTLWRVRGGGNDSARGNPSSPARPAAGLSGFVHVTPSPAAVEGIVSIPAGTPAASAIVTIVRTDRAAETAGVPVVLTVATDDRGAFRFRNLQPGGYFVTATSSKPGLAPADARSLRLTAGKTETVHLALRAGGHTIKGRVVDDGAGPIPGARVTAFLGNATGSWPARLVGFADSDGTYALTLAVGQYAVWAEADGYARGSQAITLTGESTIDFRLQPDAQLLGRVIHRRTREPVAGVEVRAFPVYQAGRAHPAVATDAEGTFQVPGLETGEWIVEARRGRLVGRAPPARVVAARATGGLVVEVSEAAVLAGRVRTGQGRAVADVAVMATLPGTRVSSHTRSDTDGNFRLEGIAPGAYELSAFTNDGARGFLGVAVQDRDIAGLQLTLAAPITVEGRVTDATGTPIAGVRVMLRTDGNEKVTWGRARIEITDSAGAFRVTGLPAGTLRLTAERAGVGVATWGPAMVEPGSSTSIELRLEKGTTLVGTVREVDGRPASGVNVYVRIPDQDDGRLASAVSGSDGRYELAGLMPGGARVGARRSPIARFGPASKPIVLAAGKESTLDLEVARTTRLRGRVLLANGQPAAGAQLIASSSAQRPGPTHPRRVSSDPQGNFVFEDVDVGKTYHVWADLPGTPGARASAPAGTEDLVLTLK